MLLTSSKRTILPGYPIIDLFQNVCLHFFAHVHFLRLHFTSEFYLFSFLFCIYGHALIPRLIQQKPRLY